MPKNLAKSTEDFSIPKIKDIKQIGAASIEGSKSGSNIVITNSAHKKLLGLNLYGKTTQDGTPSPTNPIPLVSANGSTLRITNANLICGSVESGYISSVDGTITALPTGCVSHYIPTGADRLYATIPDYDSSIDVAYVYRVAFYDEKKAWISTQSLKDTAVVLSVPQNAYYFRCSWLKDARVSVCRQKQNGYIESDGQTMIIERSLHGIPVTSGGNYTDENGQQWICDEIDYERGVYIQRIYTERLWASAAGGTNAEQTLFGWFNMAYPSVPNVNLFCTHLPKVDSLIASDETTIGVMIYSESRMRFRLSTEHKTLSDIQNYLTENDVRVSYPLVIPIETPLTTEEIAAYKALHTNKQETTIFNDGGVSMKVNYVVDTKAYVDARSITSEELITCGLAVAITKTGSTIVMRDSSNLPLYDLHLYGKTTQDGTPSPTTPIPLVSVGEGGEINVRVCGKNLLENTALTQTVNGVAFAVNDDGSVTVDGTASVKTSVTLAYMDIMIGSYILGGSTSNVRCAAKITYDDGSSIYQTSIGGTPTQFDIAKKVIECRLYIEVIKDAVVSKETVFPMLRPASIEDSSYEPYTDQAFTVQIPNGLPGIPVTFGGNYTDENGQQWICDEIDYERGVYIQRIKSIVIDGNYALPITLNDTNTTIVVALKERASSEFATILCSVCPAHDNYKDYTNDNICARVGSNGLFVYFKGFGTVDEFNTYRNSTPITVMYELEASIETPLTAAEIAAYKASHTNKPITTIFNDGGAGMSVSYAADSKVYIDNKFAALEAAILSLGGNV